MRPIVRALVAGSIAAVATAAVRRALTGLDTRPGWHRSNFRGAEVGLSGGLAAAFGSGAAAVLTARVDRRGAVAGLVGLAALAGAYDDLLAPRVELPGDKGWRGHLRALRAGRPSGGVVKIVLVGAGAVLAARAPGRGRTDVLARAVLIAGSANLLNLVDLRPGRAGKVAVVAGLLGAGGTDGSLAAAVAGAALAELPGDLGERTMLGDLGANTLGALLGLRLAEGPPAVRLLGGLGVTALTVAGERVSFSAVIDRQPLLRRLDRLGRRP